MSDLLEENQLLKQKIEDLEERLKKYTAPERNLNYYHKNKEKIAEYKKEYYLKKKEELKNNTG
jgi:cell division septum initiation protein DivIVA